MNRLGRYRLLLSVLPVVLAVSGLKLIVHDAGWEFLTLDALAPSIIAGAIFIIGFLLSHVLSDYKEAERTVSEMRVALDAIAGDLAGFARATPGFDAGRAPAWIAGFVAALETGLTAGRPFEPVLDKADEFSAILAEAEKLGLSERYVVRLRGAQDNVRRALFRIAYIQRMQFLPSVHVLVLTLVLICLFLVLFLKTSAALEAALVIGFVAYLFVYAIALIRRLETPFRKGEGAVDDVSLFLLRDLAAKLQRT